MIEDCFPSRFCVLSTVDTSTLMHIVDQNSSDLGFDSSLQMLFYLVIYRSSQFFARIVVNK